MTPTTIPDLARLAAGLATNEPLPPVERWNPPVCEGPPMRIRADGTWLHDGRAITRPALVALFARILRKDSDGRTWLVTPVEKVPVEVEDAPFLGIRVDRIEGPAGPMIVLETNVGDRVVLGQANPLRITEDADGTPRPYVLVRGRLEARVLRAPFYELCQWGQVAANGTLVVHSQGADFVLGQVE